MAVRLIPFGEGSTVDGQHTTWSSGGWELCGYCFDDEEPDEPMGLVNPYRLMPRWVVESVPVVPVMPARLSMERAQKINAALCALHFFSNGIIANPPDIDWLRPLSLSDLVQATDMVVAHNRGQQRTVMTCDARWLAAVYTAMHYEADSQDEDSTIDPIVRLPGGSCLIHIESRPAAVEG